MRYPLISFHGNLGSRDGDSPAAYRYTECKLSKAGEEMLKDIKKECVDWQLAYTDEESEPVYLPGTIPNLLVNGTSGIAVAMSCSFAPNNLSEVMDASMYVLQNPTCSIEEIMNIIQGPDFPTGGIVINKNELFQAYSSGKGTARIRGEYHIEEGNKIVFTSIPYKVSKEQLIVDIDNLCEKDQIQDVRAIRDESNKDGVRFVIELEKNGNIEQTILKLFKLTKLENTYSYNQVALVNKEPKLLNIKQLIEIYINHQRDVLVKKSKYDLDKVLFRIHILEGLLLALANIDDIILLIKKSKNTNSAKTNLMEKYGYSENQAKAILDMKLNKLAKLESDDLRNEKNDLRTIEQKLKNIISEPTIELLSIFKKVKNEFGDERRTTIIQAPKEKEKEVVCLIKSEDCMVVLNQEQEIKRIPISAFKVQKRNGKGMRHKSDIVLSTVKTNTTDFLLVFTDKGKVYRLLVNNIPTANNSKAKGTKISSLLPLNSEEKANIIYSGSLKENNTNLIFVTKNGLIKKTKIEEYQKIRKNGVQALNLREDDELVSVFVSRGEQDIILITKSGYCIRFNVKGVPSTLRSSYGVKGIKLDPEDCVIKGVLVSNDDKYLATFSQSGFGKKFLLDELTPQNRGGKGIKCFFKKSSSQQDYLADGTLIKDQDRILIIGSKQSIYIDEVEIPVLNRNTLGNQMIKDDSIILVARVE